ARVDTCDRRSSHGPVGRGRSGWSGIRSEDTDLPRSASPAGLTHPARSAGTHTRASTAPPTVRRTRGGETGRALRRRRPAAGARVRLPFFSGDLLEEDRKSTRLNSSHLGISYAVFCLKKKKKKK